MPTLLEEAHGIACFQEMSQGHTVYNSKQNFNRQRQMRINPKININVGLVRHAPQTCKSLTKVDLAWLIRLLFRHREANLSQLSMSSVGGSTSALTTKRACQTWKIKHKNGQTGQRKAIVTIHESFSLKVGNNSLWTLVIALAICFNLAFNAMISADFIFTIIHAEIFTIRKISQLQQISGKHECTCARERIKSSLPQHYALLLVSFLSTYCV